MPFLANQYTEAPIDNPNGPIYEPTAERPKESKNISKYIYVAIGVITLVIIGLVIMSVSKPLEIDDTVNNEDNFDNHNTSAVGPGNNSGIKNETGNQVTDLSKNNVCDPQENCFDNPDVCKCKSGDYCSDKKECVSPKCGNLFCEIDGGESQETCCTDCKCTIPGQVCSSDTKACEEAKMNLTKERALEIVTAYFEAQGVEITSTESLGVFEYNHSFVQRVKVQMADEDFSRQYAVSETEEVIDLQTM